MTTKTKQPIDWVNTIFLTSTPVLTIVSFFLFLYFESWHWGLVPLFVTLYIFVGLSITGGYHRLIAHKAYKAHWSLKLFYLIFGGAAVQNSALKWATDHRRHHRNCDSEEDPYNINEGFWHAHMGWVLRHEHKQYRGKYPQDLLNDRLIMWQHNNYLAIALLSALGLPILIAASFGNPLGGLFVGLLRLVLLHHTTFSINSLCHMFGSRPYNLDNTARDSFVVSLVTFGEGYHNFHHRFQTDYRNGLHWYDFDPTKWLVATLKLVGITYELKRTPDSEIIRARLKVVRKKLESRMHELKPKVKEKEWKALEVLKEKVQGAQDSLTEMRKDYEKMKNQAQIAGREKIKEMKLSLKKTRENMRRRQRELQSLTNEWMILAYSLEKTTTA